MAGLRSAYAVSLWHSFSEVSSHSVSLFKERRVLVAQSYPTLCGPVDCSPPDRPLWPWDFPGKNSGVSGHFLLQGIFPTQGWNPGLLHCRQIIYHLSHQGSPFYSGQQCREDLIKQTKHVEASLRLEETALLIV